MIFFAYFIILFFSNGHGDEDLPEAIHVIRNNLAVSVMNIFLLAETRFKFDFLEIFRCI